jgi:hypothetical protein
MENGKVKVAVDSPYVNYRYDDPYVQVEIGDRRP